MVRSQWKSDKRIFKPFSTQTKYGRFLSILLIDKNGKTVNPLKICHTELVCRVDLGHIQDKSLKPLAV